MKTTIDFQTLYGYLEDVPVEFELEEVEEPAEPYSWGERRPPEIHVVAQVTSILNRPIALVDTILPGIDYSEIEARLAALYGS